MVERRPLRNGNGNGNGRGQARQGRGAHGDKYKPEYVEQARKLCEMGHTDFEISKFFNVHVDTIYQWLAKHVEFAEAMKLGKVVADERVKRSLFHRAVGYSFEAEEVFYNAKLNDEYRTTVIKHVPPDTTAQIFWLKNRDRENWRENNNHNGNDDGSPGDIEQAHARLIARVFGVLERIDGRKEESRPPRVIEAQPNRRI